MQERSRGVIGIDGGVEADALNARVSAHVDVTAKYAAPQAVALQLAAPAVALNASLPAQTPAPAASGVSVASTGAQTGVYAPGGLAQALGGTVVRNVDAVASSAGPALSAAEQAAMQHASAVAFNDLKHGPTSVLDSHLLAKYYETTGQAAAMSSFIARTADNAGSVAQVGDTQYVTVNFSAKDGDGASLLQQLQDLGLIHGSSYKGVVSGQFDTSKIGELFSLGNLGHASESMAHANVGLVTTQADAAQHNDTARSTYGFDGTGLHIGVISDSFNVSTKALNGTDSVATNIASNDLPTNTSILQDYTSGTDEGRGMAQLIHDLAPGAAIQFATAYYGEAGFANNIIALANAGNQVIVDDVFYYDEPAFQDGIVAQAVNTVAGMGVTYMSSAGNQGTGGYEGRFNTDAGLKTIGTGAGSIGAVTEKFMEFAPGQDYLVINLQFLDTFTLYWDQNSDVAGNGGGATGDLDFYLTNLDGSVIYRAAEDSNVGASPFEYLDASAQVAGMPNITTGLVLRVGYFEGDMPDWIKIISFNNTFVDPGTSVSDGTTFGHSAADGAISVAAAPYYSTPQYGVNPPVAETFSSKGPVDIWLQTDGTHLAEADVRHSPQVTGVDGGNTTFFGSDDNSDADNNPNFYGTSAAAPDVAATALLMLGANTTLNHIDVVNLLMSSAVDMDDASTAGFDTGYDTRTGAGLINAQEAVRLALAVKNGTVLSSSSSLVYGTHFNDSIQGGANNDTLEGAGGNDTIDGGAGVNVAGYTEATSGVTVDLNLNGGAQNTGSAGMDTLTNISGLLGSDYADTLIGDANANALTGGSGADTITGNDGNDTIDTGNGSDSVDGGAGIDTLSFAGRREAVNVNLANTTVTTYGGTVTYANFENLTGTNYADTLKGDGGNNVISGGVGNDSIVLSGGDDTIDGGVGTDTVNYSSASGPLTIDLTLSTLQATGAGNQKLTAVENIVGGASADSITGGSEANLFIGNDGADTLTGAGGNDTLQGGAGADSLVGGAGVDVASYADLSAGVTVSLATGTTADGDTFNSIEGVIGTSFADTITSNTTSATEINYINAGGGNDYVYASRGGTTVSAGANNEVLIGGAGTDTVDFSQMGGTLGVNVTLAAATAQTIQTGSVQVIQLFENAVGTAFNDTLGGTAGANSLVGGDGNDVINPYFGGNDTLDGGNGIDQASFGSAQSGVTVSLALQGQSQTTGVGNMTLSNFEILIGSGFADTLSGDGANNTISAGSGNDTILASLGTDSILGGAGTDTLSYANATNGVTVVVQNASQNTGYGTVSTDGTVENLTGSNFADKLTGNTAANTLTGGAGNDTLVATTGADSLNGGADSDTVDYSTATAALSVNLSTTSTQVTGFGTSQVLANIENLIAGSGADNLIGSSADNNIAGNGGNDTVSGGVGGADTLDGGAATDTVSYAQAANGVTVSLQLQGSAQVTGVGSQTLSNFENLTGSVFSDTLGGDGNANSLNGGAGNDTLDGGNGGADTLNGAADSDTASFGSATSGVTINLATATAQTVGAGSVTLISIENLAGSTFADLLTGDANANSISGGAGNDTIVLSGGADTIDGGDDSDTLDLSGAAAGVTLDLSASSAQAVDAGSVTISNFENVIGSGSGDLLTGNGQANSLAGAAGADTLVASIGNDTLNGGSGNDTASWINANSGVNVDLTLNGDQATGFAVVNLISIENLTGSTFADTLHGDSGANVLAGLGGDDTLVSNGGDDSLNGGAGSDTADYSGSVAVSVDLSVSTAQSTGVGSQVLTNIESLIGSSQADSLTGSADDNRIFAGAGNDTVVASAGADTLIGGTDTDTLTYVNAASGVTVDLSITAEQGTGIGSQTISGFENLVGSANADRLAGDDSDNLIAGGAGADTLVASLGADTLNGGNDVDAASYINATSGVTVDLTASGSQATGFGAQTLLNIENLTGSTFGDDLTGDTSANAILALGGDDTLRGGGGDDTLNGGGGTDTVNYSGATGGGVTVDLSITSAQQTGVGNQVLLSIENLIGTGHDDMLTGDAGDNLVAGGNGDDTVVASGGTDTLQGNAGLDTVSFANSTVGVEISLADGSAQVNGSGSQTLSDFENLNGSDFGDRLSGDTNDNVVDGGAGADTLVASLGSDTLKGGSDLDTVSYVDATTGVTVDLTQAGTQSTGYGTQTLFNVENLTGSDFADSLTGDGGANLLSGRGDNDTLVSGGGDDTLSGGGGADTASYQGAGAAVTVDLSISTAQTTGVGSQVLLSIENLVGTANADTFTGNADDNSISGGAGADTIVASAGADTLEGGAGLDTVSFANATVGVSFSLTLQGSVQTIAGFGDQQLNGFENVIGSALADQITDSSDDNLIDAGAGADTVYAVGGADTIVGGAGNNLISYANAASAVSVDLSVQGVGQNTGIGVEVLYNFDKLEGSQFADTLTGNANANVITGGDGADTISGGAGADTLNGGAGVDTVSFRGLTVGSGVTVSLAAQGAAQSTGAGLKLLSNFENLIGTAKADALTGDSGDNLIQALNGDDSLVVTLGHDTLDGGQGQDTADFSNLSAGVVIDLSATAGQSIGGSDTVALIGIENVVGTAQADLLSGSKADNALSGGVGADTLVSSAGADTLNGGAGLDTVTYAGSTHRITVDLTQQGGVQATGDGAQTLNSIENLVGSAQADTFTGDSSDNRLEGGNGADNLSGGVGADTLVGGNGVDVLNGGGGDDLISTLGDGDAVHLGTGADTVVFTDLLRSSSADVFDLNNSDTIDLSAIDADPNQNGDQAFTKVAKLHGTAGEFILKYQAGKDVTLMKIDLDGDGKVDHTITLEGGDHTDFNGFVY